MSLQNSNISLRINGTFAYMHNTHAVGTDAPLYHHRGWFLHFSHFFKSLDSIFHLWHVESDVRFSQKQAEMWTRLTRELSVHLR